MRLQRDCGLRNFLLLTMLVPQLAAAGDAPRLSVCQGYTCGERYEIQLSPYHWSAIRSVFEPAALSPAQERRQIARAIALFERAVGFQTGAWRDLGKNKRGSGLPGQMDCVDESTNTTAYLVALADGGLLAFHRPLDRVSRAKWVLDIHWTAVILDLQTGQRYAVDSWFRDNGEAPYVQPLDDWLDKKPLPEQTL